MSESYLNAPDHVASISAEEYAASLAAGPPGADGCGCAGERPEHGKDCGEEVVCCKTVVKRRPAPEVSEGCCCRDSFRAALRLLCDVEISGLLDFDQSAFVTDTFVAGSALLSAGTGTGSDAAADNLAETLSGTFRRVSPCGDLLDISAVPYYPAAGGGETLPFTAAQVSLCELAAMAIQAADGSAEGDLSAEEVTARNFRRLKKLLSQRLNPCGADNCGQSDCCCGDEDACCCAKGVLSTLSGSNLSRRVTLAAGYLSLVSAELLGTVGNVLVLASDTTQRIYFVCVTKVSFLG